MPIYAYRCGACGHTRDVLQKLSDPVLTTCSSCGAEAFAKQLTAAGFQLKGSGWYVTDFRDGAAKPKDKPADPGGTGPTAGSAEKAGDSAKSDATPSTKPATDGATGSTSPTASPSAAPPPSASTPAGGAKST